jgi:hypothetical protein
LTFGLARNRAYEDSNDELVRIIRAVCHRTDVARRPWDLVELCACAIAAISGKQFRPPWRSPYKACHQ